MNTHPLNVLLSKLKQIHENDLERIRLLEGELKEARQNFRFWMGVALVLFLLAGWKQMNKEAAQAERGNYGGENVERY